MIYLITCIYCKLSTSCYLDFYSYILGMSASPSFLLQVLNMVHFSPNLLNPKPFMLTWVVLSWKWGKQPGSQKSLTVMGRCVEVVVCLPGLVLLEVVGESSNCHVGPGYCSYVHCLLVLLLIIWSLQEVDQLRKRLDPDPHCCRIVSMQLYEKLFLAFCCTALVIIWQKSSCIEAFKILDIL